MKAYKITMAVILFELSIPIAAAIGFTGPMPTEIPALVNQSLSDWNTWLSITGAFGGGVLASKLGLRINAGAVAYLSLFGVGAIPLGGALSAFVENGYLMPEFQTFITGVVTVVFIFGFIQMAGQPGRSMY